MTVEALIALTKSNSAGCDALGSFGKHLYTLTNWFNYEQ
jgi:hypothetical protein